MPRRAFLNFRHSIQARLLAGFAAMLVLQMAISSAVWWATSHIEQASAASAEGQRRYATVGAALDQMKETQLRLSEYLRAGDGDDRVKLLTAIAALGQAMSRLVAEQTVKPMPDRSALALIRQLEIVVEAATTQREALANAAMTVTQTQNALVAITTTAARAPELLTHDAASLASAESLRPFAAISRYLAREDPADEEGAELGLAGLRDDLRAILASAPDVPPRLQRLVQTTLAHVEELTPAMRAFRHANTQRADSLLKLQETSVQISDVLRATMRVMAAEYVTREADMQRARRDVRFTMLITGVLGCLLGGGIAAFLGLWITRPLRRLSEAMRRLAEGCIDVAVPDRGRRDEIGWMAAAVQVFKESMSRNIELAAKEDSLLAVNAELEELARMDALTGLANRRCFDEELAFSVKRCAREGLPLSLILIDVDHFKSYNDTYGHQAGDTCLQELAGVVKQQARRRSDLVARYGGEELAAILPGTEGDAAMDVAERMRLAVRALKMTHSGNPAGIVTASFGVATTRPATHFIPAELLRRTDRCLYAAKTAGRDQVVVDASAETPELANQAMSNDSVAEAPDAGSDVRRIA